MDEGFLEYLSCRGININSLSEQQIRDLEGEYYGTLDELKELDEQRV